MKNSALTSSPETHGREEEEDDEDDDEDEQLQTDQVLGTD